MLAEADISHQYSLFLGASHVTDQTRPIQAER